MSEMTEGIGGRKWSYQTGAPIEPETLGTVALYLSQGKYKLAMIVPQKTEQDAAAVDIVKVECLLVTAPQLWDAANELLKEFANTPTALAQAQRDRLANMVAKAVNKTNWNDVLQAS